MGAVVFVGHGWNETPISEVSVWSGPSLFEPHSAFPHLIIGIDFGGPDDTGAPERKLVSFGDVLEVIFPSLLRFGLLSVNPKSFLNPWPGAC